MVAKKPLGGYSCVSCEKNLVNVEGRHADYNPWGKFPFRDPTERIARVGHGFSKMLSMLKPEQSSMAAADNTATGRSGFAGGSSNFVQEKVYQGVPAPPPPPAKAGVGVRTSLETYYTTEDTKMPPISPRDVRPSGMGGVGSPKIELMPEGGGTGGAHAHAHSKS